MISFDSPAGAVFRALPLSRAALASVWYEAIECDQDAWGAWSKAQLDANYADEPVVFALHFLQSCKDKDLPAARQFWTLLLSFPIENIRCRILSDARQIGQMFFG